MEFKVVTMEFMRHQGDGECESEDPPAWVPELFTTSLKMLESLKYKCCGKMLILLGTILSSIIIIWHRVRVLSGLEFQKV